MFHFICGRLTKWYTMFEGGEQQLRLAHVAIQSGIS